MPNLLILLTYFLAWFMISSTMGKKSPRYVEIRIKGQSFSFQVLRIQYRDSKGRLSKFDKRKKLSMEVIAEREVIDKKTNKKVLKPIKVDKYSTGLKKRKNNITVQQVEKRIQASLFKLRKQVTLEESLEGRVKFTYTYKKGSRRGHKKSVKTSVSRNKPIQRHIRGAKRTGMRHGNRQR